jgi:hypothetical protein
MSPTVSALVFVYSIAGVVAVVVFLDWYARRRDRQPKQPKLPSNRLG